MTAQHDIKAMVAQLAALEAIAQLHGWGLLAYLISLARGEADLVTAQLDDGPSPTAARPE